MLIVNQQELTRALAMPLAIDVMRETLVALDQDQVLQPLRRHLMMPDKRGVLVMMPSYVGPSSSLGIKVITAFHGNMGTEFDSHQGAVLLFDAEHGQLLAILDATAMTAIRTAAVSAVATDALARPDASVLAILGSGTQALSHLEAVTVVRPISEVRVWSRSPENADRFARAAAGRFGLGVQAATSVEEAVDGADVICTTTAAATPILKGEWLTPGAHINAVGSSVPTARELDGEAVRRSRVFVDRVESAMNEAGDILMAIQEGSIAADHLSGEIGAVLSGRVSGRRSAEEITLFKSLGLGAEDVAGARAAYAECRRLGIGLDVPFGGARHA